MNKPLTGEASKLEQFVELFFHIQACIDGIGYPLEQDKIIEVGREKYKASFQKSLLEDVDFTFPGLDFLSESDDILRRLEKTGKVTFKVGSTDAHKLFFTIVRLGATDYQVEDNRDAVKRSLSKNR